MSRLPPPRLSSLFLLAAVGLAALAAFSATPGDEAGVRSFVSDFTKSLQSAGGAERIAAFYAGDASHIGAAGEQVHGPGAFARDFDAFLSRRGAGTLRPIVLEIAHISFISERVALVDGSLRVAAEDSARFTFVTRLSRDGWKIAASRMAAAPLVSRRGP